MCKSSPTRHIAVRAVRKASALLKKCGEFTAFAAFSPFKYETKEVFFGLVFLKMSKKSLHCTDYSTVEGPIMQEPYMESSSEHPETNHFSFCICSSLLMNVVEQCVCVCERGSTDDLGANRGHWGPNPRAAFLSSTHMLFLLPSRCHTVNLVNPERCSFNDSCRFSGSNLG